MLWHPEFFARLADSETVAQKTDTVAFFVVQITYRKLCKVLKNMAFS